jgi:ATP-dependent DNA helicase PIF1
MRAKNDIWFVEYLLRIGNGTEKTFGDDYVQLPDDIIVEWSQDSTKNAKKISSRDNSIVNLIRQVFPKLEAICTSADYMRERAILSTTNEHVDAVNAIMIESFYGNEKVYYSFASVDDDTRNNYPLDFLNSITPNGLPPHELKVKKDCPVILLCNLDPHNGLCNDTRLVIRGFQNNTIDAEIVNGQHAGTRVFIPRIPMSPSEDLSLAFKFKRKQFPIRLSFAMTINKAQC